MLFNVFVAVVFKTIGCFQYFTFSIFGIKVVNSYIYSILMCISVRRICNKRNVHMNLDISKCCKYKTIYIE